ncbi:hypothetical protein [Thalassobellus citreus]|uniref:hypothetical protein n=1 Tax=Thalassobellus citreus TaxID=3367752 RepID=UPI0037B92921
MKSKSVLKLGIGLFVIVTLCFVSFKSFAHQNIKSQISKGENISVTIDKRTSEADFKDIKSMLNDHGIEATFSNIERNDLDELTGIKIKLDDGNRGSAASAFSSNFPIDQITFGRKDDLLFITQGKNNALGFNKLSNLGAIIANDSLMGQNFGSFGSINLNDFFNDDEDSLFFNGSSVNINSIRQHMQQFFNQGNNSITKQSYSFYDDPNTNKLIIIDGKESDFETLNKLSKENKLDVVDNLKPKTAMSLYGKKAKDGAIIVSTK